MLCILRVLTLQGTRAPIRDVLYVVCKLGSHPFQGTRAPIRDVRSRTTHEGSPGAAFGRAPPAAFGRAPAATFGTARGTTFGRGPSATLERAPGMAAVAFDFLCGSCKIPHSPCHLVQSRHCSFWKDGGMKLTNILQKAADSAGKTHSRKPQSK